MTRDFGLNMKYNSRFNKNIAAFGQYKMYHCQFGHRGLGKGRRTGQIRFMLQLCEAALSN